MRGIDRRTVIGGTLALGLVAPATIAARRSHNQPPSPQFTHGVASGEPGQTRMLFWTRHVPENGRPAPLRLELSTRPDMSRAKVQGETQAAPDRDWTARVVVEGLEPGQTYYYRFHTDRQYSEIGRARTLPDDRPEAWRMGVAACSGLAAGWYNGYAHALAADDVDLFVHLGNYLHPLPAGMGAVRSAAHTDPYQQPQTLEQYWAAYRATRNDPDLRALHARTSFVALLNMHAPAGLGWLGGGGNGGLPQAQMAVARRAFVDWLPVSDAPFAQYDIGRLATLYRLDMQRRNPPLVLASAAQGGPASLVRLRDEQWLAGNRQMLGYEQENWLFDRMTAAGKAGIRWQIVAQQPLVGDLLLPPPGRLAATGAWETEMAALWRVAGAARQAALPSDMTGWSGYPAARARLLATAQRAGVDLLALSGDTHHGFAQDLAVDGRPAGVEFGCPALTDPGLEARLATPPADAARAFMEVNPHLRSIDLAQRGYLHLTLSPAQTVAQWRFTGPAATHSPRLAGSVMAHTLPMQRRVTLVERLRSASTMG